MKKWIKSLMIPVVVAGIIIPVTAQAETNKDASRDHQEWKHHDSDKKGHEGGKHYKYEYIENQEQNLVSLSEQYAPELKPAFNQVFNERKELINLYRNDPAVQKHFAQKREAFKAKREEFNTKYKSQLDEIHNRLKTGKMTKQDAMQKRFDLWKQFAQADPDMKEKMENFRVHKELHMQLEKAVDTKNQVEIKSVLQQLLKAEQNRNYHLKSEINKIKNL